MGIRARMAQKELIASVASMAGPHGEATDLRNIEMSGSIMARVFKPMLKRLYGLGNALTPAKNLQKLSQELERSGMGERLQVADFLGLRFLCAVIVGIAVFFGATAKYPITSSLAFSIAGFAIGLYLPNFWLKSRVKKRQND